MTFLIKTSNLYGLLTRHYCFVYKFKLPQAPLGSICGVTTGIAEEQKRQNTETCSTSYLRMHHLRTGRMLSHVSHVNAACRSRGSRMGSLARLSAEQHYLLGSHGVPAADKQLIYSCHLTCHSRLSGSAKWYRFGPYDEGRGLHDGRLIFRSR
jgi:hypothetical protein